MLAIADAGFVAFLSLVTIARPSADPINATRIEALAMLPYPTFSSDPAPLPPAENVTVPLNQTAPTPASSLFNNQTLGGRNITVTSAGSCLLGVR